MLELHFWQGHFPPLFTLYIKIQISNFNVQVALTITHSLTWMSHSWLAVSMHAKMWSHYDLLFCSGLWQESCLQQEMATSFTWPSNARRSWSLPSSWPLISPFLTLAYQVLWWLFHAQHQKHSFGLFWMKSICKFKFMTIYKLFFALTVYFKCYFTPTTA